MNTLRELKIDDNTLVIVTSDNGPRPVGIDGREGKKYDGKIVTDFGHKSAGGLRGFKASIWDGGHRVPFIARWKGQIPAGRTSDEIIAFQDMMPTFTELAGAKCPENIDGISVIDALMGSKVKNPHDYLYWDYGHCRDRYDQAVRMGNWKGIREGKGIKIQLYDLTTDLGEENDVADKHPKIVEQIEKIIRSAVIPSKRYPVGEKYTGGPIWKKNR